VNQGEARIDGALGEFEETPQCLRRLGSDPAKTLIGHFGVVGGQGEAE
jgi:hypothetical protein